MLKRLIEKQLLDVHSRNSSLLERKNITFFTSFNTREQVDWEQVDLDFLKFRTITDLFVYILADLSPDNSVISQVIEVVEMSTLRISYVSTAYLSFLFDKKKANSLKKANLLTQHTVNFVKEIVHEVKECGGKVEFLGNSVFPNDKTYFSVELPIFLKNSEEKEDEHGDNNSYLNWSLEGLINTIESLRAANKIGVLSAKQINLMKKAIKVKKRQLQEQETS